MPTPSRLADFALAGALLAVGYFVVILTTRKM